MSSQTDKPSQLERDALRAWRDWGSSYSMFCRCSGPCGEMKHCRGKRRRRMLCLECWDQQ